MIFAVLHPVRLAGSWWLVLICSESTVGWSLVCLERKVLLAGVGTFWSQQHAKEAVAASLRLHRIRPVG
jgi:hypothetical protein